MELQRKYASYFRNRGVILGESSSSDVNGGGGGGGGGGIGGDVARSNEFTSVELELDDLNQHECMCAFVELLQSLVVNKITPIYDRGHVPSEMPPWMSFLQRKCVDVYAHDNIKLFILRGLMNAKQIFRAYARFWYAPIMGFLVNCASLAKLDYIDSFTLDLMVLMLSWHSVSQIHLFSCFYFNFI